MITVFTPSYNRGNLLPQILECLKKQSHQDFEWVIVDDGSSDDTKSIVAGFQTEFPIRYFYQPNHGKHTAINLGVAEANGDLFLMLDSDDELPADSLVNIAETYATIKDNPGFAGICGMMAHRNGDIISNVEFTQKDAEYLDCDEISLRYKYHATGDLCEIFKTEVLKEFPFPVFEGERFCPEILVWHRIARKYKLRVFDKVIYYRDYLDDGLTSKITDIRRNSPKATDLTYSEMMRLDIPFKYRLRAWINLWRFRILSRI